MRPELKTRRIKLGETIIDMRGITKEFPGVLANDHINFKVRKGEIHALLGENGAGKTTLMNILYGLYRVDEGEIYVKGAKANIRSPRDAIELGIGMVHQHFMLCSPLSVIENVILGQKSPKEPFLAIDQAKEKVTSLSKKFGLEVDPKAQIWQLSVGEKQRVEIIKALYRGADILILDEPTTVLTPQEVEGLLGALRSMVKEGLTVIFITHKLREVESISHRITVLRDGRVVDTLERRKTDQLELARLMVGREVLFRLKKAPCSPGEIVLEAENLHALGDRKLPALRDVSFRLREGEILGVAGVAGNGQRELVEVITGLRKAAPGKILIGGEDVTNRSPKAIIELGVAHIPEDRRERGVILDFSLAENVILERHSDSPFSDRGPLKSVPLFTNKLKWFLNSGEISSYTDRLISDFDVKTPRRDLPAMHLSGGNLQKLILARELSRNPKLILANKPTMGLDVGSTEFIRHRLLEARDKGAAVLLVSEDLDEILQLSDKIAVMYEGEIVGIVSPKTGKQEIGLMMGGARNP
jgi:simple sugar transport system ATP-binding protein